MSEIDADIEGDDAEDVIAIAWPPAELEIALRSPVTFKDEVFDRLLLREPTMSEWEQIFEHPPKTRRRFGVSLVGGLPMGVVAMIGIGDVIRGEKYLNAFFEAGQAIGDW